MQNGLNPSPRYGVRSTGRAFTDDPEVWIAGKAVGLFWETGIIKLLFWL
ncbi:hypothetical protein [Tychonema sp. LEGE 07203]|nr:hypothetical protein [Tychonema sp. LEGE 07203]MBE9092580.1 hypothetical protein [Tychonema sp. LEGE 07203]